MSARSTGQGSTGQGRVQYGAVVLTGGTARRMGGTDKAGVQLDGVTLLERALAATTDAHRVVVVGTQVATSRLVLWTLEQPPRGGPAAGLLAAIDRFPEPPPELLAVLAVDMPRVTPATFTRLAAAVADRDTQHVAGDPAVDGALLEDGGRRQPLCAVYRTASLQRARPAVRTDEHGLAMFSLLTGLRLVTVPAVGDEARDVDTWADLTDLGSRRPPA